MLSTDDGKGCVPLPGAVLGDIIGSRFEFAPTKSLDFDLFTDDSRFTDDSVLTLATAWALLENCPFDQAYREFFLRYPHAGYGQRFTCWARESKATAYGSYGNGSAMRVSPLGWWADSLPQVLELAWQSAVVTHSHPQGIKGAQAVAALIFLARQGRSKRELALFAQQCFGYDLTRSIDSIRPTYTFDVRCQGSVPEAICAFLESEDLLSAIRIAISLGGDADTQAAIAGSIAEAFYSPSCPQQTMQQAAAFLDPFLTKICIRFAAALSRPVPAIHQGG